jgi:hypothetical protein
VPRSELAPHEAALARLDAELALWDAAQDAALPATAAAETETATETAAPDADGAEAAEAAAAVAAAQDLLAVHSAQVGAFAALATNARTVLEAGLPPLPRQQQPEA